MKRFDCIGRNGRRCGRSRSCDSSSVSASVVGCWIVAGGVVSQPVVHRQRRVPLLAAVPSDYVSWELSDDISWPLRESDLVLVSVQAPLGGPYRNTRGTTMGNGILNFFG